MTEEYQRTDPINRYRNEIINILFGLSQSFNDIRKLRELKKHDRMLMSEVKNGVLNLYIDLRPKIMKYSKKHEKMFYVVKKEIPNTMMKAGDELEQFNMLQETAKKLLSEGFLEIKKVGYYEEFIQLMDYYNDVSFADRGKFKAIFNLKVANECFQVLNDFCEIYGITDISRDDASSRR